MSNTRQYKAGDLGITLQGTDKSASSSIKKVIGLLSDLQVALNGLDVKKLDTFNTTMGTLNNTLGASGNIANGAKNINSLSRALSKFNGIELSNVSSQFTNLFTELNKISGLDTSAITKLNQASKAISNLSKIGKIGTLDFSKISSGFAQLSTAIDPFLAKVKEAEASLTALNGILKSRALKGANNGGNKGGNKSGGILGGFGKGINLLGTYYILRRIGTTMAQISQSGADYTETLNLWETAMRNNLDMASEFVKRMNTAYGISEKTLMNAQATFKNMLGSLGQISEETAYALSEGVTQMAIDYASLYNVQFEKAFEKFQSALAGQVRPIRSVSGYDITENTIFELYKQLGGTKSVRNLSRTEKQLLGLLAIFNQMQSSGAIGDLDKTITSFANQSRILAETWKEFTSYVGILLSHLIKESGLLTNISATLMFITDILREIAISSNAIQHFEANPFADMNSSLESANKQADELQGKLLGFDKFRALDESSGDGNVAIDSMLTNALKNYESILQNASNSARELANQWKITSGLFNKDGTFNLDKWKEWEVAIKGVVTAIGFLVGAKMIASISTFVKALFSVKNMMTLLTSSIELGVIIAIVNAIEAFNNGDTASGALAITIGSVLVGAFVALKLAMIKGTESGLGFLDMIKMGASQIGILTAGLGILVGGIMALSSAWGDMGGWQRAITIISAVTAGIIGLVVAIKAFQASVPVALGVGMALAGGVLMIGSMLAENDVNKFAEGGLPDKGTMFLAGEAGAEIVYNNPNGQSGVVNIQQIRQAQYQALSDWWQTARNDIPQLQEASSSGIYELAKGEMIRRGEW